MEGNNVTLHCNASGNPTPNITWTKDGSPTILYQGETYDIVNVTRQTAGDYTCTAWDGVGDKANATATVTVHYNGVISQKPSSKVVVEGENVTLRCNATGNPAPNITWTKDGSPTVLYQGETYNIVNIQRQAAGDYTCTAWNGVGEKTNATATLAVHCKLFFLFYLFIFSRDTLTPSPGCARSYKPRWRQFDRSARKSDAKIGDCEQSIKCKWNRLDECRLFIQSFFSNC